MLPKYLAEDALVDHFINTCGSHTIRRKLLSKEDLDLETLLKIASTSELVENQAKVMEEGNTTGEVYALRGRQEDICHGCSRTCYKCGVLGHFSTVCHGGHKGKVHSIEEEGNCSEKLQSLVVRADKDYPF